MRDQRVLLIIGGGIAAYKVLELIRRCRERGLAVRCVMTAAAQEFVTPLSVAALAGDKVYADLFSLTDEAEMGHIRLSREADLLVVAPATANLLARMAQGLADDLATTVLLATDKPVLVAPAMNPEMWAHPATQRNLATLRRDGIRFVGPEPGEMACGEVGLGRMAEPSAILAAIEAALGRMAEPSAILAAIEAALAGEGTATALTPPRPLTLAPNPPPGQAPAGPLVGRRALVTSGPTFEAIDPVRFIGNRSSGRQGHAVAAALHAAGAEVTLVTGPVALAAPDGVRTIAVEAARDMLAACEAALPVDVAVCAAAVADWRPATVREQKLKKDADGPPVLHMVENPDILRHLATHPSHRPGLVVGFAAETGDLERHAAAKLASKGCDWLLANDVGSAKGVFGGERNTIHLFRPGTPAESWPTMTKAAVAERLAARIAAVMGQPRHAA